MVEMTSRVYVKGELHLVSSPRGSMITVLATEIPRVVDIFDGKVQVGT